MGRFFVIAAVVVAALVLAPVLLLSLRSEEEYEGKVVYYGAIPEKVKSIDPATCGDTISASMQGPIYESLFAYHYLKRPVELVPELVEDFPAISDDALTYTFKIRPGIFYSRNPCFGMEPDGRAKTREVRAEDFVLALKRIADFHLQTTLSWSFLSGQIVGLDDYRKRCEAYKEGDLSRYDLPVEGLEAPDARTLRIRLCNPFPAFVHVLAINTYAPVPRELVDYHLMTEPDGRGGRRTIPIEQRTPQINRPEQVVGTGAYILTQWERNGRMIFERNPEYKHGFYPTEGAPGDAEAGLLKDAGKQLPFIDVLHYKLVSEDFASWLLFLSRQLDVSGIPRDVFERVITIDRRLSDQWTKKGLRLVTYEEPNVFWLAFNMTDPVVGASKSLRQGMCMAFNVEEYIEVLANGRGHRAVNILPGSFPGHKETGPGPYFHFDLDAARLKLKAAEAELAAVGQAASNGGIPSLTIDLPGQDETSRRMGEFIKQQFDAVGLQTKIQLQDWPTLQQKVHNKQCQLYLMGWSADYPDPENFLQLYYGPNIDKGTNNSNYRNPEYDALYEKIRVMPDSPERLDMCVRMARMINEDVPVLLLSEPDYFVLIYNYINNYKRHPFGYGMVKYLRLDDAARRSMEEQ